MADRSVELLEHLDLEMRGLEDQQLKKLQGIFNEALSRTIRSLIDRLEKIDAQPIYDPKRTPGAFQGSTPAGPEIITPLQKNQASLYLQGQLLQDLQVIIGRFPQDKAAGRALDTELVELFRRAHDLGSEYAIQLSQNMLEPAAKLSATHPLITQAGQVPPPAAPAAPITPGGGYQEGQSFTRLVNIGATVAAAERDFKSLSENYRRQRDAATSERVVAAKDYFYRWWRDWGDAVQVETATQLATGLDSRALARTLKARLPNINEAFRNRAETVARTETHIAAGEARERTFRRVGAGFVRYITTADDRVCEWCAPRMGCLYWAGSIKTPIHPNCRCALSPITLESLVIQNSLAAKASERWEQEQQALAAVTRTKYEQANSRPWRPTGGGDQPRGAGDFPLMEKTSLPATQRRRGPGAAVANAGAQAWPAGDPVWAPGRGWLDQGARVAYEAMVREVAEIAE